MSFIFQDKNFLNLIYKMAQEATPAVDQQLPPLSEELINKVFDNLKAEHEGKKFEGLTGKSISDISSEKEAAWNQPTPKDISNFKIFYQFCKDSEVAFSGNKVVVSIPPPPGTNYQASKGDNTSAINKDGMVLYLEFLKSSPDYGTNRVYTYMLGELIRDINRDCGINVSTYEDEIIASLKKPVNVSLPFDQNKGNIPLKVLDLRDFAKWYRDNGMSVTENANLITEDNNNAKCALLKYLYTNADQKYKEDIKSCGNAIGCDTSGWDAARPSLPGSSPAQPATPASPGAPGGGINQNLSEVGRNALTKLLAILAAGGPFEMDQLFIGSAQDDTIAPSITSFCNNAKIYFDNLKDISTQQDQKAEFDSISKNCVEFKQEFWNLYTVGHKSTLRHETLFSTPQINPQFYHDYFTRGISGLDGLLTIIRDVCQINNLMDKYNEQRRIYRDHVINLVRSVERANSPGATKRR